MKALFPKTKVFYIRGDVDRDMMKAFLDILNEEGSHIRKIYFTSGGGDMTIASCIINMLNNSEHKIEVIGNHILFSAGFDIFFGLDSTKIKLSVIERELRGMIHMPGIDGVRINTLGEGNSMGDIDTIKFMKSSHDSFIASLVSLGINKAEIRGVVKDHDVYLTSKRMIELLKNKIKRESAAKV